MSPLNGNCPALSNLEIEMLIYVISKLKCQFSEHNFSENWFSENLVIQIDTTLSG